MTINMDSSNIVFFSRKEAYEKGYRSSIEINKDSLKRPMILQSILFKKDIATRYSGYKENESNKIKRNDVNSRNILKRIYNDKTIIDIEKVDELKKIKNKTIAVYVESYFNGVYTVRDTFKTNIILKMKCDEFCDIAGRFVYINFDKDGDKYYFKKVIESLMPIKNDI